MTNLDESYYMGIDPGGSGGLAVISHGGLVIGCQKMPATERDIWEWIVEASGNVRAVIEYINPAYQGTAKGSMAKLYGSYMQLRGYLVAAGIPFETALTRKWANRLGVHKSSKDESRTVWKNRLKAAAQSLFPQEKITLATADALLIAEYCRRIHNGIG